MFACYAFGVILIFILMLYVSLELHYFLRTALTVVLARFCKKKVHIMEETSISGICLMTDIDTFLYHMNNARYIRELDFARVDFFERTGVFRLIRSKGGSIAMGATTIRYRRFIKLFNKYIITSKVIYWDSKSIFMEHRFITPSEKFVNAIIISRTRLINCNADDIMDEMLTATDVESCKKVKPEVPLEVTKWIESNDISSANLKTETTHC